MSVAELQWGLICTARGWPSSEKTRTRGELTSKDTTLSRSCSNGLKSTTNLWGEGGLSREREQQARWLGQEPGAPLTWARCPVGSPCARAGHRDSRGCHPGMQQAARAVMVPVPAPPLCPSWYIRWGSAPTPTPTHTPRGLPLEERAPQGQSGKCSYRPAPSSEQH